MSAEVIILPIRHGSPRCAAMVARALDELRPGQILIEGPRDFARVDALSDDLLKPPIALFAHAPDADKTQQNLHYCFGATSPELAAFRWAGRARVPAAFCDVPSWERLAMAVPGADAAVPWSSRLDRLGVRDLDELWETAFEIAIEGALSSERDEDWRTFFGRVARFGDAARAQVDAAEHRALWQARETAMAAAVLEAQQGCERVVLIAGAVHCARVEELLRAGATYRASRAPRHAGIHLVAIDEPRLAAMSGGYPAYQRSRMSGEPWQALLSRTARAVSDAVLRPIGTADRVAAAELTQRLALFRGRQTPIRTDLRDAILSAWGQGDPKVVAYVDAFWIGEERGAVPQSADECALRADARRELGALRLWVEPGDARQVRVRPMRSARDLQKAQRLAQLEFLGLRYAELSRGPSYLNGTNLDRVEQCWEVAPGVEDMGRWVEANAWGSTLREVAAALLMARMCSDGLSSESAVARIREACALGLHALFASHARGGEPGGGEPGGLGLFETLRARLDEESRLGSALGALDTLWMLYRYHDGYGVLDNAAILELVERAYDTAIRRLDELAHTTEDDLPQVFDGLRLLHLIGRNLGASRHARLLERLGDLLGELADLPGVRAAVVALQWSAGLRPERDLLRTLAAAFAEAAIRPDAPGYTVPGTLVFARRAYLEAPAFARAVTDALVRLTNDDFMAALPGLRLAHAQLTPWEIAQFSQALSALISEYDGADAWAAALRWRLVLGAFAEQALGLQAAAEASGFLQGSQVDDALSFLYDREYYATGRGMRGAGGMQGGRGGHSARQPLPRELFRWLERVRGLFARSTVERIQVDAFRRYGLTQLLMDAELLQSLEPSMELVEAALFLRDHLPPDAMRVVRRLIETLAKELSDALLREIRSAFGRPTGHAPPGRRGSARQFDARTTIRRNLRHYDAKRRRLVIAQPWFRRAKRMHLDWHVILVVDKSGSMVSSTIHAAIMAGAFASVDQLDVSLLYFDTEVLDVSDRLSDPVELILSVAPGGGTHIAQALAAAEALIKDPARTIVVLVSDLDEGGARAGLFARASAIVQTGATFLTLAALTDAGEPYWEREVAQALTEMGVEVGALSPNELVRWVREVVR